MQAQRAVTTFVMAVLLSVGSVVGQTPGSKTGPRALRRNHEVFAVTATAGFETGLVRLASISGTLRSKNLMPARPMVDWGDDSQPTPALFTNCALEKTRTNCDVLGTHVYEEPGEYTITINFSLVFGGAESLMTTATVTEASGLIIVSIGDSVASGEGNPVNPTTDEAAQWDDVPSNAPPYDVDGEQCHRSSLSGPALAAEELMQSEDGTFIHLACSGGVIDDLIEQLWTARSRLPRIDVLVMSGGANDIAGGFGNVITGCIDPRPRQACSTNQEFIDELGAGFDALPAKYADLDQAVRCLEEVDGKLVPDDRCNGDDHVPSLVVITEYFDPTRNRLGEFPGHALSTSCVGHAIAPEEWAFLYDNMVVPLNNAVATAAETHDWVLVTGIADAFREHGYCASIGLSGRLGDSWVVKLPDSVTGQSDLDDTRFPLCFAQDSGCDGDITGTGHPNLSGQTVYRDGIVNAVVEFLAPTTTAAVTPHRAARGSGESSTLSAKVVTLDAMNRVRASGVGATYYAVDDPACSPDGAGLSRCAAYTGPFVIDEPGRHVVTYFSENAYGLGVERAKTVEVFVEGK